MVLTLYHYRHKIGPVHTAQYEQYVSVFKTLTKNLRRFSTCIDNHPPIH